MKKEVFGGTWLASFSCPENEERKLMDKFKKSRIIEIVQPDGKRFKFYIRAVKRTSLGVELELGEKINKKGE